jgi:hypothetical protein
MFQAAGLVEPLQKAAGEGGLADPAETLNENPGGLAAQGALQGKNGAVTADEAVGIFFAAQPPFRLFLQRQS